MNIQLPDDVSIGVFRYDNKKNNGRFEEKDTLFIGKGEDFRNWSYNGPGIYVIFRLRHVSMIPVEMIGILGDDGIILIKVLDEIQFMRDVQFSELKS